MSFAIAILATAIVLGLARLSFTEGRKAGQADAVQALAAHLEDSENRVKEWYDGATDWEKIDWRASEIAAYCKGLREARQAAIQIRRHDLWFSVANARTWRWGPETIFARTATSVETGNGIASNGTTSD